MVTLVSTWVGLVAAGIAGLGLGIGVVVGSAIVRATRERNGESDGNGHRH